MSEFKELEIGNVFMIDIRSSFTDWKTEIASTRSAITLCLM